MFTLPTLNYTELGDFMTQETLTFHHGKHHAGYVKKLNAAIEGTDLTDKTIEGVITHAHDNNKAGLFNNAAQHFNHSFFWDCFSETQPAMSQEISDALTEAFDSVDSFKEQFSSAAAGLFGSGWVWLVKNQDGALEILDMSNAGTPLTEGKTPLLTIDVWEHAYYIDHRNARATYIEKFWDFVNWDIVATRMNA